MAEFVIIPDTSSDMPKALRERFDIPDYIPGVITPPGGSAEYVDMDWEQHTPKAFFDSMSKHKEPYRTALAPLGDVIAVYEKWLAQGKDILAICLSSGLSGTYHGCQMAAKELMEKYPERKIVCVDSLRYSGAIALLTILAAQKRDSGASLEETAAYLEETRFRIHQMGTMDDLFFLVKTGRISNFKAFFGTMVGLNVLADFNRKGLSEVLGKAKGKKTAMNAMLGYMEQTIEKPEEQIVVLSHSNRPEAVELLADCIQERFSPREIITLDVGMSCGASIGPGLCVAFYLGTPVTETMEQEKQILTSILQIKK